MGSSPVGFEMPWVCLQGHKVSKPLIKSTWGQ